MIVDIETRRYSAVRVVKTIDAIAIVGPHLAGIAFDDALCWAAGGAVQFGGRGRHARCALA